MDSNWRQGILWVLFEVGCARLRSQAALPFCCIRRNTLELYYRGITCPDSDWVSWWVSDNSGLWDNTGPKWESQLDFQRNLLVWFGVQRTVLLLIVRLDLVLKSGIVICGGTDAMVNWWSLRLVNFCCSRKSNWEKVYWVEIVPIFEHLVHFRLHFTNISFGCWNALPLLCSGRDYTPWNLRQSKCSEV